MKKGNMVCYSALLLVMGMARNFASAAPIPSEVEVPTIALKGGTDFAVTVTLDYTIDETLPTSEVFYELTKGDDVEQSGSFFAVVDGELATTLELEVVATDLGRVGYQIELSDAEGEAGETTTFEVQVIPEALTLLPPFVTLAVAIYSKNVFCALFSGVYFAAFLIANFNIVTAFMRSLDTYIVDESYADVGHVYVIVFCAFLAGMVAVVIKNGGGYGLAEEIGKRAKTPRAGALGTMAIGILIFFNDYANTLIVGQTMRAVTDALLISREKLSFLVDATSAPIASLAPISSWIGYEVGLISDTLASIEDSGEDISCYDSNGFIIFIKTIPSRFYPFLVLVVQFILIVTGREMGPMLTAERRARRTGKVASDKADRSQVELDLTLEPEEGTPRLWWNAIIPIFVVIFVVLLSMIQTGKTAVEEAGLAMSVQNVFGEADTFGALLWATFLGSATAWLLSWLHQVTPDGELTHPFSKTPSKPILTFTKSLEVWISGIRGLTTALMILIMAWAIGAAFTACGTGEYVASALGSSVDKGAFPALTFIISAILSSLTGTSWGTMAIMFPLVLPAAHIAAPCDKTVVYGTISSILSGAVYGDHCSPISDTTVMSALATKCDLQDHVKTQIPYAFFAAAVGVIVGEIPTGYGAYPDWVGLLLGIVIISFLTVAITVPIDGDKLDPVTRGVEYVKGLLPMKGKAAKGEDIAPPADSPAV